MLLVGIALILIGIGLIYYGATGGINTVALVIGILVLIIGAVIAYNDYDEDNPDSSGISHSVTVT